MEWKWKRICSHKFKQKMILQAMILEYDTTKKHRTNHSKRYHSVICKLTNTYFTFVYFFATTQFNEKLEGKKSGYENVYEGKK